MLIFPALVFHVWRNEFVDDVKRVRLALLFCLLSAAESAHFVTQCAVTAQTQCDARGRRADVQVTAAYLAAHARKLSYSFTWWQLRALGLETGQLQRLQPDKNEWLQSGGIQVSDLLDMTVFPVNPLTDFGVDLAELWQLRCGTATMVSMGITFDHLIAKGITPQVMAAFALPLSDWIELGFGLRHAEPMRPEDTTLVFGIEKAEFIRLLHTFQTPANVASAGAGAGTSAGP